MKEKTVKTYEGEVVSKDMDKTVKVKVLTWTNHPIYKKVLKRHKYLLANIGKFEEVEIGDKVKIMSTKPYSKNVTWVLIDVKKDN